MKPISVKFAVVVVILIAAGAFILQYGRSELRAPLADSTKARIDSQAKHDIEQARLERERVLAGRVEQLPNPYARLLASMNRRESQLGTDGKRHSLDLITGVRTEDGLYLYDLIREVKPRRTAEVGLAEGFSALYMLAGLHSNGGGSHVAMDPFEVSDWKGLALQKVREAGATQRFRFLEAFSSQGLPRLTSEGLRFDIIFVDGDHRFDAAFTDFILADAACAASCYILLHDYRMPSVAKVVRFLETNRPDYARRPVPERVNMAAFQKVGKDRRDWKHFVDF